MTFSWFGVVGLVSFVVSLETFIAGSLTSFMRWLFVVWMRPFVHGGTDWLRVFQECVFFQKNPFGGLTVFPEKSYNFYWTKNKNTHFTTKINEHFSANVSSSKKNNSFRLDHHSTTTTTPPPRLTLLTWGRGLSSQSGPDFSGGNGW